MTNDELEAVRARAEAATPGPWSNGHDDTSVWGATGGCPMIQDVDPCDGLFIAHARTDIPALLDALTRAEAHAERLASLMGEMFESGTVEVAFAGNPIPCDDLERRIRSALSAYRGEMK